MIANLFDKLRMLSTALKPRLKLLNLGCGSHFHPEWVNVDMVSNDSQVIQHDLLSPLPFKNSSFAVVYHSHVLEHFPRQKAAPFLNECYRLLAPGGTLRVAVPDLEVIARLYLKYLDGTLAGDKESMQRHEWMTLELLDQLVRDTPGGEVLKYWRQNPMPAEEFVIERTGQEVRKNLAIFRSSPQPAPVPESEQPASPVDAAAIGRFRLGGEVHKWMYDRCSLRALLEKCGFVDITVCGAGESRIPDFNRYGLDLAGDGSVRKPDSLFMEASKA